MANGHLFPSISDCFRGFSGTGFARKETKAGEGEQGWGSGLVVKSTLELSRTPCTLSSFSSIICGKKERQQVGIFKVSLMVLALSYMKHWWPDRQTLMLSVLFPTARESDCFSSLHKVGEDWAQCPTRVAAY